MIPAHPDALSSTKVHFAYQSGDSSVGNPDDWLQPGGVDLRQLQGEVQVID
jgi:hypothetical protein